MERIARIRVKIGGEYFADPDNPSLEELGDDIRDIIMGKLWRVSPHDSYRLTFEFIEFEEETDAAKL